MARYNFLAIMIGIVMVVATINGALAALTDNQLFWLDFDTNASGVAVDASGVNANGTIVGGDTLGAGVFGKSLRIDGQSDSSSGFANITMGGTQTTYTLVYWLKRGSNPPENADGNGCWAYGSSFYQCFDSGDTPQFYKTNWNNKASTTIKDDYGGWTMLVYMQNSSGAFWYINNTAAGTAAATTTLPQTLWIGTRADGSAPPANFNGSMDMVAAWSRNLGQDEIAVLWNNSHGYNLYPPAAPPAAPSGTNLSITAANNKTGAALTAFNVTLFNSTVSYYYTTSTGTISANVTNGTYNIIVRTNNYFWSSTTNIEANESYKANLTSWDQIVMYDAWDNIKRGHVGAYNITYNGTTYFPDSTNITHVPANNASTRVTLNSTTWQSYTIIAWNSSSATPYNGSVWQAVGTFNRTSIHTGTLVTGTNFTTSNQKANTTLWLHTGANTINAQHSSWNDTNATITASAFSNTSYTVTGAYNLYLNITVKQKLSGVAATTITAYLTYGGINTSNTTTTGTVFFPAEDTTYNITVRPTGYEWQNMTATLTANITKDAKVVFLVYTANTFEINFFNEDTNTLINDSTFTVDFIGTTNSFTRTTTNGTLLVELAIPDMYHLRYDGGALYPARSYYTELNNNSAQNLTLYSLNNTRGTLITVTTEDQNANKLEGALVKVLRFYVSDNAYKVVEMGQSNNLGQSGFWLVKATTTSAGEYYKFIIEYPQGTVKLLTNPGLVFGDINYKLSLTEDYLQSWRYVKGTNNATYAFTFSNATNTFSFTWADNGNMIQQGCIKVTRRTVYGDSLINTSCAAGSTGSVILTVNTTGLVIADAYIDTTTSNSMYYIDQLSHDFSSTALNTFGRAGVFYQLLITLGIGFALIWVPEAALIGMSLSFIVGAVIGLMSWPWSVLMAFILLAGMAVWRMRS